MIILLAPAADTVALAADSLLVVPVVAALVAEAQEAGDLNHKD